MDCAVIVDISWAPTWMIKISIPEFLEKGPE